MNGKSASSLCGTLSAKSLESRYKCIEKVFWNYSLVCITASNFLLILSSLIRNWCRWFLKIFSSKSVLSDASFQIFPHRGKICQRFQNLWPVLYKQSPRNYHPLTSQNRKIDVCTFNPRIFPLFLYSSLVNCRFIVMLQWQVEELGTDRFVVIACSSIKRRRKLCVIGKKSETVLIRPRIIIIFFFERNLCK